MYECWEPRIAELSGMITPPAARRRRPNSGGKEKTCGMSLRDFRESPGGNARRLIAVSSRDSCARHLPRTLHEKAPMKSRPRSGSPDPQWLRRVRPPISNFFCRSVKNINRVPRRGRRLKTSSVTRRGH